MSIILKTLKTNKGKIVAEDNKEVSDIYTDLINTSSTGSGTGLGIIEDDGAYYIPSTLIDRQAIIDATIELANTLKGISGTVTADLGGVTQPIQVDFSAFTPTLDEVISNLQQIKSDLK